MIGLRAGQGEKAHGLTGDVGPDSQRTPPPFKSEGRRAASDGDTERHTPAHRHALTERLDDDHRVDQNAESRGRAGHRAETVGQDDVVKPALRQLAIGERECVIRRAGNIRSVEAPPVRPKMPTIPPGAECRPVVQLLVPGRESPGQDVCETSCSFV